MRSAFPSFTLLRRTSTATSLPPSAGRPSRPPRPFSCPSSPCCPVPMMRVLPTSRQPGCGVRIRLNLRNVCADACERAWARSKQIDFLCFSTLMDFLFMVHLAGQYTSQLYSRFNISGSLRLPTRVVCSPCLHDRARAIGESSMDDLWVGLFSIHGYPHSHLDFSFLFEWFPRWVSNWFYGVSFAYDVL